MGRFLEVFRPISRFMPEVKRPDRRVPFNTKLLWTGLALIIYLIMSEIPLYGIAPRAESEALFTMRVVFASKYGTL
ncbi:MAG: preprotein translocase subunit SecY, partial [Candidatus Bathyarchaeota archaeon B23]